jgi:hypothetical protein
MTVSGTNTFNLNRNEIIGLALQEIGVQTFNRVPTAPEIESAALRLNILVKSWKNLGLNLWKSTQGTLFCNVGLERYRLDGITANATESYTYSVLTADSLSGTFTITVSDPTQFTVGYNIGVMQNNNTSLWTTIISIVGSVVTLASPLTANASTNNYVYSYRTKIKRPEDVTSLRFQMDVNTEVPNTIYSNDSYFSIPVKNVPGIASSCYYDKQLTYGDIYLWPVPDVNTYFANFTFQKQFDDFITATTPRTFRRNG